MTAYNLMIVYHADRKRILMCRRRKPPYQDKLNLVGGKLEPGEDGLDAAYRELWEETGIERSEIQLTHLMDMTYFLSDLRLEVYVGGLSQDKPVYGEENELVWIETGENLFDQDNYAGEGNLGHMLAEAELYRDQLGL